MSFTKLSHTKPSTGPQARHTVAVLVIQIRYFIGFLFS